MNNLYNVINFHVTEKCNYSCNYCFAQFNSPEVKDFFKVIDEMKKYFDDNKITNGRINISGGEPLLCPNLDEIINYINEKEIAVSIITNGSLLTTERIISWKNKVSMIGISVDSLDSKINLEIGRHDKNNNTLDETKLLKMIETAKQNEMKVKINVVVSKYNLKDKSVVDFLKKHPVDKVKFLQVLVNKNNKKNSTNIEITDYEYNSFCEEIDKEFFGNTKIVFETSNSMIDSYIIINPSGKVLSNKNGKYEILGSVLHEDLKNIIDKNDFNHDYFKKRYEEESKCQKEK